MAAPCPDNAGTEDGQWDGNAPVTLEFQLNNGSHFSVNISQITAWAILLLNTIICLSEIHT